MSLLNIFGIIFLDFSDPVHHVFLMEDWGSSLKAYGTQSWGMYQYLSLNLCSDLICIVLWPVEIVLLFISWNLSSQLNLVYN